MAFKPLKLLQIFLDKDQKHFSIGEQLSLSIFILWKDEWDLRNLAEQQFLAEIKVARVSLKEKLDMADALPFYPR